MACFVFVWVMGAGVLGLCELVGLFVAGGDGFASLVVGFTGVCFCPGFYCACWT